MMNKTKNKNGVENTNIFQRNNEMDKDPQSVLRDVRTALVEFFIAFARLAFFWLPGGDLAKGRALMALHPIFMVLVIALFFVIPPRHPLRTVIVMFSLIVVASQWLLGGCVVTRAEQRLTGQKDTILDPFLSLARVAVNRDTRIATTVGISTTVCSILLWSILCDATRVV